VPPTSGWVVRGGRKRHTADALTAATVAGLAVQGVPLGTAVVTTYPRHPLALASQALTVQAATGNRLTLGIEPGHKERVETTFGMTFDRPARHTREYLSVLMPLLHGEPVEFSGEIYRVAGQASTPGAQPPSVLLAALGPIMLRTAGELADGTVTVWTGVRTIATHIVPRITAAAGAAGRPAPRVVVNLPIAVTDDPEDARAWIAGHFGASSLMPSYRAMFELECARGAAKFLAVPFGSPEQVTRILTYLGHLNQAPAST